VLSAKTLRTLTENRNTPIRGGNRSIANRHLCLRFTALGPSAVVRLVVVHGFRHHVGGGQSRELIYPLSRDVGRHKHSILEFTYAISR
jgi:hypothetical protein